MRKIVSGGQTGVDRGALDAALALGFPCGGWCPGERQAEDGPIDPRYPVEGLPGAGYEERTVRNVEDSDGTAVLHFGPPEGGTALTARICRQRKKPHVLIDGEVVPPDEAARLLAAFVRDNRIERLNVAGPRASKEPRAHPYAFEVICRLIEHG
jgi:hypothetical protein